MEFSDPVEHIASLLTDNGYDRNDGNNAWFELSGQQQQDVVSTLLVLWPFRKQQAQPGESPEHTIDNHSRRVGKKSMQQRPMQQPASWCGQEQHTVATHANKSGLRSPMLTQAAGVPHQQAQPGENPEHTNNTQPRGGAGKNSIRSGDSRIHESGIARTSISGSIDRTSIGNGVNASTVAEDNPRTGLDLSTVADDDPATISSKEQEQQQGQEQEQQQQSSCQNYIYMHQLRGHKFPEGSVSPPDSASSLRGERAGGRAIPSSPGMGMGAKRLSALCAAHFQ
jgi:hypothetical protein